MKELKIQPVVDKISNYKINGYSMSRERADLDSHMPS
jgi:hypothetical protein